MLTIRHNGRERLIQKLQGSLLGIAEQITSAVKEIKRECQAETDRTELGAAALAGDLKTVRRLAGKVKRNEQSERKR